MSGTTYVSVSGTAALERFYIVKEKSVFAAAQEQGSLLRCQLL